MANEWVSPTGHIEGVWSNATNAYDNNLMTRTVAPVRSYGWGMYIELTINPIYCSKVRFSAGYDGTSGINSIDLDVYYDSGWHDVFEGSYLHNVWTEKDLSSTHYVTRMRMRFYNTSSSNCSASISEAMFYETSGVPKVTTNAATGVEDDEATLNGNITDIGGATVTRRGFEYKKEGESAEPLVYDDGTFGTGTYSYALTGLDPTEKYDFRAYAENSVGTGYGSWLSFGVSVVIPTVTTSDETSVDYEKATLHGEITKTGGQDCEERGFEWKIGESGGVSELRETGTFGIGTYSLLLEDLDANITYYFRAYAKNDKGTGYGIGSWLNFPTDKTDPTVITHNTTEEKETQVTGNGEIVKTGGADCDEVGFEYGLTKTATWIKNEVVGSYGVGFFALDIKNLEPNTEYWYRAYAKRFV